MNWISSRFGLPVWFTNARGKLTQKVLNIYVFWGPKKLLFFSGFLGKVLFTLTFGIKRARLLIKPGF